MIQTHLPALMKTHYLTLELAHPHFSTLDLVDRLANNQLYQGLRGHEDYLLQD